MHVQQQHSRQTMLSMNFRIPSDDRPLTRTIVTLAVIFSLLYLPIIFVIISCG